MASSQPPHRNFGLKSGHIIGPTHHTFKLLECLHDTACFQLWRAEDLKSHNIEVSLQLVDPQLARKPAFVEQFKRVINHSKLLDHPHIAEGYGYFIHNRQILFSAGAALDGRHLGQLFESGQVLGLSLKQRQGLLSQLAQALDFGYQTLHRPHGTLAPEQVYLNRNGGVQLSLYGSRGMFSCVAEKLKPAPGYLAYQAPEAFHEDTLKRSADIYSLAALSYALYTGQAPFRADEDEASRVQKELDKPEELSETAWQSLQAALDTDPQKRPATAVGLIKALLIDDEDNDAQAAPDTAQEKTTDHAAPDTDEEGPDELPTWLNEKHQRWLIRGAVGSTLFAAGAALGFWLGLWMSDSTIEALDEHVNRLKTLSQEQETLLDAANERHRLQQNQIRELEALLAEREAQLEDARAPDFTLFRDPLALGDHYGPDMVEIPSGSFLMGDDSKKADDNEKPAHQVTISEPFALAQHEVSFAEYDLFAKATGRPLPDDNGWGRGKMPVINVSWQDANAYASWLAEQTGLPYRLPTEAEWEYAARAGTQTDFWWGNQASTGNTVCSACGTQYDGQQPAPAGELALSPWGLSAMNGNVDEWVQDCYRPDYTGAPVDGSAWLSAICEYRVMRGGSWFDIPRVSRASSRYRHPPGASRNNWGFRVALDLPATPDS